MTQLEMFQQIWQERTHECELCKQNGIITHLPKFDVWSFAHILGKGAWCGFKLYKPNIALLCRKCHTQYDDHATEDNPFFNWIHDKAQQLKQLYNSLSKYERQDLIENQS